MSLPWALLEQQMRESRNCSSEQVKNETNMMGRKKLAVAALMSRRRSSSLSGSDDETDGTPDGGESKDCPSSSREGTMIAIGGASAAEQWFGRILEPTMHFALASADSRFRALPSCNSLRPFAWIR